MSEELSEGRNWTNQELDLIVSDYFLMLSDEAAGIPFNKAQHNRLLRSKIDRSEGSIEFKHQNISAVLQQLGLPRIRGYLPAANYQKAIIASIDRYLSQNPLALHPERAVASGFAERPGLFVETPPMLLPIVPRREELVFQFERERLKGLDRSDLAKNIRWVSEEDGDGAGYDILSFDEKGKERFLEVKTTVGSDITPFYITRNELSLSSERPEAFRLCRVFDFSIHPRMFELAPPLEKLVHLSPLSYEASFS